MNVRQPLKVACSRKELSCIIASLFSEVRPVCDVCETLKDDDLVMCGLITGTEEDFAYIKLTDYGFEYYGDNDTLEHIRGARCLYGTAGTSEEDGGAAK